MSMIVNTKPEFQKISKIDVIKALNDPDENNLITREVERLIKEYAVKFQENVQRIGSISEIILKIKPIWPIENVAMMMAPKAI